MWLVGMMGSGKTSVGRLVADAVGFGFYDTDEAVESMCGRSVTEIWHEAGEDRFRELERIAVEMTPSRVVAAAGGGAVLDTANVATMRRRPPVVWLRARPATLAKRLTGGADRPLLTGSRPAVDVLREILASRAEAYESAATHQIETDDRTADDVATEVTQLWPG